MSEAILQQLNRIEERLAELEGQDRLPPVMGVSELSERWQLHPETIREWARQGRYGLKPFNLGSRQLRFSATTVRRVEKHF